MALQAAGEAPPAIASSSWIDRVRAADRRSLIWDRPQSEYRFFGGRRLAIRALEHWRQRTVRKECSDAIMHQKIDVAVSIGTGVRQEDDRIDLNVVDQRSL